MPVSVRLNIVLLKLHSIFAVGKIIKKNHFLNIDNDNAFEIIILKNKEMICSYEYYVPDKQYLPH